MAHTSAPRLWVPIAGGENPSPAPNWLGDLGQVMQFVLMSSSLKEYLPLVGVKVQ